MTRAQGFSGHPRRFRRLLLWSGLIAVGLAWALAAIAQNERQGILVDVEGVIGPATADHVVRVIERAAAEDAELVIMRIDTPGGLDSSMRMIISQMLASPVPIVAYVGPPGARAASAGTYILYAASIATMAPSTHLGAATPVRIGGLPGRPDQPAPADDGDGSESQQPPTPQSAEDRKAVEDAVAYIRGLAERNGRNAQWAEEAVREAATATAAEALDLGVIDLIADNLTDLLRQLDGRTVSTTMGEQVLDTASLNLQTASPDWRTKLLSIITNPNIAYLLMLIGIYGLIFELANPGTIFSGVIGAISLLLALYAFQVLPINYAGLALILLGMVFIVAEAFVPSFGVLGIGGIVAFSIGSVILVDDQNLQVSLPLIGGTALFTAGFFAWGIGRFVQLRQTKVVSGQEQLIDSEAVVQEDFEGEGPVWLHSERWTARSRVPLRSGQRVRVTAIHGLILEVVPIEEPDEDGSTNKN
ncbi:MAG: NfeD family protein [Halothiobacillaceae bacterium]